MSIKQTKGYINLEGKIKFLGEKSYKSKPRSRELSFAIETKEDNIINVRAFGWIKEDTDQVMVRDKDGNTEFVAYGDALFLEDGKTVVGTSVKTAANGEISIMVDVDAVELIKNGFKNGDSVFVSATSEVDTYFNTLKWTITKIYKSTNEIDFSDHQEVNNGKQWIAFNAIDGNKLKGYVLSRKEEMLPIEMRLDKEYLSKEDFKAYKLGDLVQVDFELTRIAEYKEVEDKPIKEENKFKPKGKYAKTETQPGKYKTISGFKEEFVAVGISNEKINEITGEDLAKLSQDPDMPF